MKAYEEKLLQKAREEEVTIKTDPERILLAYEQRKKETPGKKKKKWVLPLSLSSSLLVAASIAITIVVINNQGDGHKGIPFKPEASSVMVEELFSFHSFEGDAKAAPLMRRSLLRENDVSTRTPFYQTASTFDKYYSFFSSCYAYDPSFLEATHVVLKDPFLFGDHAYSYKGEFTYDDKEMFTLYYSDMSGLSNKKEATFFAYYESEEGRYEVTIEKEEEIDEDEREKQISLSFFSVDNRSDIFLIERKEEIEEKEEERSYSLERFDSVSSYEDKEPYLSLSFEIEKDHNEETSFEVEEGEEEYEYENILSTKEGFSFDASFDNNENEYRFENVALTLLENGRSYSHQEENYFFAK